MNVEPVSSLIKVLKSLLDLVQGSRSRHLKNHPIAVTIDIKHRPRSALVTIYVDNDADIPLEIADCYMRRLGQTAGCIDAVTTRDLVLQPRCTDGDSPITIPGNGRRTWELEIHYSWIADTQTRETQAAEERVFGCKMAEDLRKDRERRRQKANQEEPHPLVRFMNQEQMRLWAVVVLRHRSREFESRRINLPPLDVVRSLKDWSTFRTAPRARTARAGARRSLWSGFGT